MRLQKVIARSGIASRREAERLIASGVVCVNDSPITQLGTQVLESDHITIRGRRIFPTRPVYIAINKPRGYICSAYPSDRFPSFLTLLPKTYRNVHHAGRLDVASEGLLLAISDGTLTHIITHPKFEVPKFYRVKIRGVLPSSFEKQCICGKVVDGEHLHFEKVHINFHSGQKAELSIKLIGGKNREIRRLISALGLDVMNLVRVGIGSMKIGTLSRGKWRMLHMHEVDELYRYSNQSR